MFNFFYFLFSQSAKSPFQLYQAFPLQAGLWCMLGASEPTSPMNCWILTGMYVPQQTGQFKNFFCLFTHKFRCSRTVALTPTVVNLSQIPHAAKMMLICLFRLNSSPSSGNVSPFSLPQEKSPQTLNQFTNSVSSYIFFCTLKILKNKKKSFTFFKTCVISLHQQMCCQLWL